MSESNQIAIAQVPDNRAARRAVRGTQRREAAATKIGYGAFMLRFVVAFVVVLGAMWAYVAALPIAFQDRDYPLMIAKRDIAARCDPNAVAVFGDSRAVAGVAPRMMAMPVQNLALSGTSPVETYFAVSRLLRCPVAPRLVVIAHSATTYAADAYFWQFDARTGFLDTDEIRQVVAATRDLDDHELEHADPPGAVSYAALPVLYALRFPALYFGSLVKGYVAGRLAYNLRVLSEVRANGGHALFGTAPRSDDAAEEKGFADWRASPLIDLYFRRTLALLAAHKVAVAILTMPVNEATCREMPSSLQRRFTSYIAKAAAQYPNIIAVDPVIGCWPGGFFGDAWHFNQNGATAFSAVLSRFLAGILPVAAGPGPHRATPGHLVNVRLSPPIARPSTDE